MSNLKSTPKTTFAPSRRDNYSGVEIDYSSDSDEDYEKRLNNKAKGKTGSSAFTQADSLSKEHKKYEEQVNKLLGPVEKKIKKTMNTKLKKKYKQQKKAEEKKILMRIGENEENLYDFIQDFSSSDYETASEGE